MSSFEWKDEYSINIKQMDEEHKKLVHLIDKLDIDMTENTDREVVLEVMDGVIDYVKTHFASEEKLMSDNDFPDFVPHRRLHIDLTIKAAEMRKKHRDNEDFSKSRISEFLIQWLVGHIMTADRHYGKFLNEKGIF